MSHKKSKKRKGGAVWDDAKQTWVWNYVSDGDMTGYEINKSGRTADVDVGMIVGPHLTPLPYSVFDNYSDPGKVSTYHLNTNSDQANPQLLYWNSSANTGSYDPWPVGLSFKTMVPQNEALFAKNPWFFANGEAREWYGGAPQPGDIAAQLSLTEDGKRKRNRLTTNNDYAKHSSNYVDRFWSS